MIYGYKFLVAAVLFVGLTLTMASGQAEEAKAQTTCPMTGNPIDKKHFVEVDGKRIYLCCPACAEAVKKDPAAALAKLAERGETAENVQTTCPIMGGKINKQLFADVNGKRIYVCCAACIEKIKADPDAALKKLADKGQAPEPAPEAK